MIPLLQGTKVFLALGSVDMRKAIDGLSQLVAGQLQMDPFSGHLFAFCNRRRNLVKILLWERNGFWLFQKRLERQVFHWPRSEKEVLELGIREMNWLLDGLDPLQIKPHKTLHYSNII